MIYYRHQCNRCFIDYVTFEQFLCSIPVMGSSRFNIPYWKLMLLLPINHTITLVLLSGYWRLSLGLPRTILWIETLLNNLLYPELKDICTGHTGEMCTTPSTSKIHYRWQKCRRYQRGLRPRWAGVEIWYFKTDIRLFFII